MSAALQPELDLAERHTGPLSSGDIDTVVAILDHEQAWLTAAQLLLKLGEKVNDNRKRKLRRIAENSQGKIISGQAGYKHIRHATAEEILHAANWLEHQAVEMGERAKAIRRAYHALPHTPK